MTGADQAIISHNDIDRLALNVLPILATMGLETDTWDTIYIAEDLANMVNQFLPSVSDGQTPEDLAFWENVIEGRIHVQLDEESNTDEIEAEAYRLIDLDLASKQVYLIHDTSKMLLDKKPSGRRIDAQLVADQIKIRTQLGTLTLPAGQVVKYVIVPEPAR